MTSSNGNIFRVTGHLCRGIHRSPVNSRHKDQWRGALMFSFICTRINGWVNNGDAGDLRCHRAHYDVAVMATVRCGVNSLFQYVSFILHLSLLCCMNDSQYHLIYYEKRDTYSLTHWGQVTNICAGNLTIIGSDNGLSPEWRQAIIWTNAGILSIGPLGTKFNEISMKIQTFPLKKMHFKMSSAKWRPFYVGLNGLIQ